MPENQFAYTLKLRPDLLDEQNWTQQDETIVNDHFLRLQQDTVVKKVILAGRTLTSTPEGFGIVIFEADSEQTAREYMELDPAVKAGIMNAVLFPFRVALKRIDE